MQFHLICSQNEPMWGGFLQTQRAGAVLRFVNNLINVLFIISACIADTQKHLAPTPLQEGAGKTLVWFYLLANLLQM